MIKTKKLLLGLGGAIAGLSAFATLVSCKEEETITNLSGIKEEVTKYNEVISKAKAENKVQNLNITLLTAGGKVDDKSFNQSIYEAMKSHSSQAGYASRFVEPQNDEAIKQMYNQLIQEDSNVWILTGFQHGYLFLEFLKANTAKIKEKKVTIIAVDWDITESELSSVVNPGQFISLNYKTQEAGWIAGYASSKFLSDKEEAKRKVATFAGEIGAGATDFVAGYLSGIKYFNDNNAGKETKLSHETVTTNTGFSTADLANVNKVRTIVSTNEPTIVLPVAGSMTNTVLETEKTSNKGQLLIGVDTDQKNAFEASDASRFFTSIEKKLGSTVYRTLTDLYLLGGEGAPKILDGYKKVGETGAKNFHVNSGFYEGFVGISKTGLTGGEGTKAEAAINEGIAKFKSIVTEANKANSQTLLKIPVMDNAHKEKNQPRLDGLNKRINSKTAEPADVNLETTAPTPSA